MTGCSLQAQRTPNSIHVPLFANETVDELRQDEFAGWPQVVQNITAREIDRWAKRNPDKDIVEQNFSYDAALRVCVTEFHYAARVVA